MVILLVLSNSLVCSERIYGKEEEKHEDGEPKMFSDVCEQSSPAEIAQVADAAREAMNKFNFNEACRLFTIAHLASKRRNPYFALCRAECHRNADRFVKLHV